MHESKIFFNKSHTSYVRSVGNFASPSNTNCNYLTTSYVRNGCSFGSHAGKHLPHISVRNPSTSYVRSTKVEALRLDYLTSYVRNGYSSGSHVGRYFHHISILHPAFSYVRTTPNIKLYSRYRLRKLINPDRHLLERQTKPPRTPRGFLLGTTKIHFARLNHLGSDGRSTFGERK